jgi:hypothetical protein
MVDIVTRAGKGSPLTNAEVDANFANLNNGKVETNSGAVIAALGYTPYNATNPGNFLDQAGVRGSFSVTGDLTYNSTTGVFGVNVPVTSVFGRTGAVALQSGDVTGALGFTPAPNASPVFTGASTFANGTASAPGIRFTTEANTGFYRSGTNQISVTTNGSLAATFAANGDFTAVGSITANSDERLKKDWSELSHEFVERLAQVKCGTYTRIDTGDRQIGVSAQSLFTASPEGVVGGDYLSVAYGNVALVACVKLAQKVLELEQKLAVTNQNIAEVRGK